MDEDGRQPDQEEFERRLYQALALIERAGEQQRAAAATLERLSGLEERVNQVIRAAGAEAATRIAGEAATAVDGAISAAAENMRQAARSAVAAAENLRLPWWLNLAMLLLAGLCGACFAFWATHRVDLAYFQYDQRNQQLIREGRTLERIWPKLTPVQRKRLEQLDTER